MAATRIYHYPIWIRIWHTFNALTFLLLVLTGISLHFTGSGGGFIRFDVAVAIHNSCALIMTLGYGTYLLGNLISGNGKFYRNWTNDLKDNIWKQLKFYTIGIFRKEPHPFPINETRKFNPLQKVAYVAVMYLCMPLLIISGLGLLFPETIINRVFGISGLALTGYLHTVMGFVLSIFLIVHIYTCTLGEKPGSLFRGMLTGYHEEHG